MRLFSPAVYDIYDFRVRMQFYATHGHTRPSGPAVNRTPRQPRYSFSSRTALLLPRSDCGREWGTAHPPVGRARWALAHRRWLAAHNVLGFSFFTCCNIVARPARSYMHPVNGTLLRLMVCLHPSRARDACPQGQCPSVGPCQKSGRRRPQQHPNSRDGSSE